MRAVLSKAEIESEITDRFGTAFKPRQKRAEVLSSGVPQIDTITGGLPRGAITEVFGSASSGRMSLMVSILAQATNETEVCALVDTTDAFDPAAAAGSGIVFDQLLWVRCSEEETSNLAEISKIERAFKAADLLLQSGGFGLVILDLADITPPDVRRIISSWWFRFRRAIENTPTVLVVIAQASCVGSRASQALEMAQEGGIWTSLTDTPIPIGGAGRADIPIPLFCDSIQGIPQLTPVVGGIEVSDSLRHSFNPRINHSILLRGLRLRAERQKPVSFIRREVCFTTTRF